MKEISKNTQVSTKLKVLQGEPPSPINVNNIKQAKKLLSKIIRGYQQGTVDDARAKTTAYLLQVFVQLVKDTEIEERLGSIEETLKNAQS